MQLLTTFKNDNGTDIDQYVSGSRSLFHIVTPKNIELWFNVSYNIGGTDYSTDRVRPRGYRMTVYRQPNKFHAYTDLSDENGAVNKFIKEVGRKSQKAEREAKEIAFNSIEEIAQTYNLWD